MTEIQAPFNINFPEMRGRLTIFLGGTIDMGNSSDWQDKFVKDNQALDVIVYNPRRDDWDSAWEQNIDNVPFKQQVEWELDHLDAADVIVFNFEPSSKSPITLAELGLHLAKAEKAILVRCPQGFYRKGNVDIMCERFGVPVYDTLEELHPIVRYLAAQKSKSRYAKKERPRITGHIDTFRADHL